MNNNNQAIANPDANQVNKAMQRCLVKAIALHGIALYIFEGEDIPEEGDEPDKPVQKAKIEDARLLKAIGSVLACQHNQVCYPTFDRLMHWWLSHPLQIRA